MEPTARLIILGDAGPIRREMLQRSEIDSYWAMSLNEVAAAVEKSGRFDICIVSSRFAAHYELSFLRDFIGDVPCLVIVSAEESAIRLRAATPNSVTPSAVDLATAGPETLLVDVDDIETALSHVARLTGLTFAKDPRVPFVTHAILSHREHSEHVITRNLSISGIALSAFPELPAMAKVTIELHLLGHPFQAQAHVIRTWQEEGTRWAGLSFLALDGFQLRLLQQAVAFHLLDTPAETHIENILDNAIALNAPNTAVGLDLAAAKTQLREVLQAPQQSHTQTADLAALALSLTNLERKWLLFAEGPEWIERAVDLRLGILAQQRQNLPIPSPLMLQIKRYLEKLDLEANQREAYVVLDITRIRSGLLREMLRRANTTRHGTVTRPRARLTDSDPNSSK